MSDKKPPQTQEVSVSYEGPLPTSREFAGYEQALPGAADRILAITEKEAEHRRANQEKLVNASIKYSGRGQIFALIIAILSIFGVGLSIYFSAPIASIAPAIIAITGLASIFTNKNR
ncbi:MAG: DUF2335 domain-containing protein [Treponema sp.]|jgi:uncharacterized membrane protein|nr:DUF2335 domain-containing protein [Treponema sp.]